MTRPYGKHRLTDEQRKLAESGMPLVWWMLGRLIRNRTIQTHEKDDCLSYLMQSLCRAAELYDPQKGTQFSTFATGAMKWGLCDYLRDRKSPVVYVDDNDLKDLIPDPAAESEPLADYEDIEHLMTIIPVSEQSKKIIELRFKHRKPFLDIMRTVGLGRTTVMKAIREFVQEAKRYRHNGWITAEAYL